MKNRDKAHIKILIIDDEKLLADVLMKHFRNAGYTESNFVTTEKDVFGYIRESGFPDIFITDFLIEGATHGNCLHMIEELQKDVPLIIGVTSFFDDMEVREMLFHAGACDVESKTNFNDCVLAVEHLMKIEEQLDDRNTNGR